QRRGRIERVGRATDRRRPGRRRRPLAAAALETESRAELRLRLGAEGGGGLPVAQVERRECPDGRGIGVALEQGRITLTFAQRRGGPAPLLEDVRELVGDERVSDRMAGPVFAGAERDVAADRERARLITRRQLRRGGAGVDVYVRETGAERRLHAAERRALERPAAAELGPDRRRMIGRRGASVERFELH